MPTHDGSSTMVGNAGEGYAKITPIAVNPPQGFSITYSPHTATTGEVTVTLSGTTTGTFSFLTS
jgi:hypothetical protein